MHHDEVRGPAVRLGCQACAQPIGKRGTQVPLLNHSMIVLRMHAVLLYQQSQPWLAQRCSAASPLAALKGFFCSIMSTFKRSSDIHTLPDTCTVAAAAQQRLQQLCSSVVAIAGGSVTLSPVRRGYSDRCRAQSIFNVCTMPDVLVSAGTHLFRQKKSQKDGIALHAIVSLRMDICTTIAIFLSAYPSVCTNSPRRCGSS